MRTTEDRTEKLLALLIVQTMKGATQKEKAVQLSLAGFTNVEIADLLRTKPQAVAQYLYEARKSARKKK